MAISLFIYRCISRYSFLAVSEVLGKYSAAHHWAVGRKLLDDCDEALEGLTAIIFYNRTIRICSTGNLC